MKVKKRKTRERTRGGKSTRTQGKFFCHTHTVTGYKNNTVKLCLFVSLIVHKSACMCVGGGRVAGRKTGLMLFNSPKQLQNYLISNLMYKYQ